MTKPQGFSIIELVITVAIIAILSLVGALGYSQIRKTARDAQRQMVMKDMSISLDLYRTANFGFIPPMTGVWQNNFTGLISGGFLNADSIELEPLTDRAANYTYTYCAGDSNHKYLLMAFLERPAESQGAIGSITSYQAGDCANQTAIIGSGSFPSWQAEMICGSRLTNGLYVYCLGAL